MVPVAVCARAFWAKPCVSFVASTLAGQATADWNSAVAEKNERLNDYILALHVYNAHQQRHRDVDQPKMAAVRRGDELLV